MREIDKVVKLVSVVIPVFKPDLAFFRETVDSVLNSGIDKESLELIVVNDYVGSDGVTELVGNYAGQIQYHENPGSVGIAGNWNRCIELATGRWVHILHQDDTVLPGFYRELLLADAMSDARVFVSRYFLVNEFGNIIGVSQLEQECAGFLEAAPDKIIRTNTIQCPSIAVRKDVYTTIGGFNPSLTYVLDWEMWFRVSLNFAIWYLPVPLTCFRKHSLSETPRAKETGESARDLIKGAAIIETYAPDYALRAREYGALYIIATAVEFLMKRQWKQGVRQLKLAPLCSPQVLAWRQYWHCWLWVFRVLLKDAVRAIYFRDK